MMKRVFAPFALAFMLHAAPVHAIDKTTEIPVLIAESVDAHGIQQPPPPIIAAVVNLLAEETGLNLVIRPYPWRRAVVMAEHGDGLLYGAASTPERQPFFKFTKPVYDANQWLVSAADAPLVFHRWEDLRDKVISIGGGGKFGPEFEARRDKLFKIEQNNASTENRLKMLSARRVDAVLLDSFRNPAQLGASLNCRFPSDHWVVAEKSVGFEPLLIAVPKHNHLAKLLPTLNNAITRLTKNGSMQKAVDSVANVTGC
ncbi:MAG TPA: ABC transporter substrate-binding protein [Duganella sp.]|nr:ABC transporter substrate-binding protein [Duganella sp.]